MTSASSLLRVRSHTEKSGFLLHLQAERHRWSPSGLRSPQWTFNAVGEFLPCWENHRPLIVPCGEPLSLAVSEIRNERKPGWNPRRNDQRPRDASHEEHGTRPRQTKQLPNHSKGHNQHSLLSVGLTVEELTERWMQLCPRFHPNVTSNRVTICWWWRYSFPGLLPPPKHRQWELSVGWDWRWDI